MILVFTARISRWRDVDSRQLDSSVWISSVTFGQSGQKQVQHAQLGEDILDLFVFSASQMSIQGTQQAVQCNCPCSGLDNPGPEHCCSMLQMPHFLEVPHHRVILPRQDTPVHLFRHKHQDLSQLLVESRCRQPQLQRLLSLLLPQDPLAHRPQSWSMMFPQKKVF